MNEKFNHNLNQEAEKGPESESVEKINFEQSGEIIIANGELLKSSLNNIRGQETKRPIYQLNDGEEETWQENRMYLFNGKIYLTSVEVIRKCIHEKKKYTTDHHELINEKVIDIKQIKSDVL